MSRDSSLCMPARTTSEHRQPTTSKRLQLVVDLVPVADRPAGRAAAGASTRERWRGLEAGHLKVVSAEPSRR